MALQEQIEALVRGWFKSDMETESHFGYFGKCRPEAAARDIAERVMPVVAADLARAQQEADRANETAQVAGMLLTEARRERDAVRELERLIRDGAPYIHAALGHGFPLQRCAAPFCMVAVHGYKRASEIERASTHEEAVALVRQSLAAQDTLEQMLARAREALARADILPEGSRGEWEDLGYKQARIVVLPNRDPWIGLRIRASGDNWDGAKDTCLLAQFFAEAVTDVPALARDVERLVAVARAVRGLERALLEMRPQLRYRPGAPENPPPSYYEGQVGMLDFCVRSLRDALRGLEE